MRMFLPTAVAAAVFTLAVVPSHAQAPRAPVARKKPKPAPEAQMGEVTWKVEPADVIISVNGKKLGPASKAKAVKLKAGTHMVHLQWKKDEVEEPVTVEAGKSSVFQYTFEDSGAPPAEGQPTP